MPFGGATQKTPTQVMAALLPVLPGQETDDCSVMSWGFDPESMDADPFDGARRSVILSLAKLCAAGCDYRNAYLTFQEYFEKLRQEPTRWGKPFAALLGALEAQLALGVAAIGGKDSMSGSFLDMDVPPTLVSFAMAPAKAGNVLSPEFKSPGKRGHPVYLFGASDTLDYDALKKAWTEFHALCEAGKVKSAWAVEYGVAEAVMKMSFGNRVGFRAGEDIDAPWYNACPGAIVAELSEDTETESGFKIGVTTLEPVVSAAGEMVPVTELLSLNEGVLEDVYPNRAAPPETWAPVLTDTGHFEKAAPKVGVAKPRVLIPVFPGTNCEYDSARAVTRAGLDADIFVINNQSAQGVEDSAKRFAAKVADSQIIFIPGGFSGGDEPDGSGKFITAFFRNPGVTDAVMELLKARDGLILGVCNGFQALIKLGLVPYGEIRDMDADCPTLSYNVIGRHQSRIVRTRVASRRSPWLSRVREGDIVSVPISHGARMNCSRSWARTARLPRSTRTCAAIRP